MILKTTEGPFDPSSALWSMACRLFVEVYSTHDGPEPEAFAEAIAATEPLIPSLREVMGFMAGQ